MWYGRPVAIIYFKIFGRKCYIKINDDKIRKIEPRGVQILHV